MRFTIEQVFLTDPRGLPASADARYELVEAEDVDTALADFLRSQGATLVGNIQKYPGFHAVATARSAESVFTVNLLPGSDTFHRRRETGT